jgi:glycosyltransferase involved in cell wall biosynthesis
MRVALVHDWLTGMRGGEKVLDALARQYPDAELFTLLHVPGTVSPAIERLPRHTSFVQHLPGARRWYRHYLPLFPAAIEGFDLDGFDLVISTSHCAAKSVIAPGGRHLCYCFTPMRYAWDQFDHYFGRERLGPAGHAAMRMAMRRMARWDRATSGRPNRYVAISRYVASRIRRYYNRDAVVVYPPVDTGFFHPDGRTPGTYFLVVSALVPYKRLDLGIEAARRAGVALRIVGDGPERRRLSAMTGSGIELIGTVSDTEVRELYRGAAGVLLTNEEDFGIVPVEAQACGRPVIALARGGALETVVDGVTGRLVAEATPDAFAEAMRAAVETPFDAGRIRAHAETFDTARFTAGLRAVVEEMLAAPPEARW